MKAFISHNKSDKATARILAVALVEQGENVWFDEWDISPGESIVGGIEEGIANCDVYVLIWSKNAAKSNWVGTEIRSIIRRRVDDQTLKIVPILVDETPLPSLVAEYRGFLLENISDIRRIASEIVGGRDLREVAQLLQRRLHELADAELSPDNPLRVLVCPRCASKNINIKKQYDGYSDEFVYFALCSDCDWGEAKKAKKT